MVEILLASHRAVLAAHGLDETNLPVEEMARNAAQIMDLEQQALEPSTVFLPRDLRDRLGDICSDEEFRVRLFTSLEALMGNHLEDVLWFVSMLASRSPIAAARVFDVVHRLSGEALDLRAHRRIEQHLAALGAEHSPPHGWEKHVLDKSRAQDLVAKTPQPRVSIWRRLLEWLRRN